MKTKLEILAEYVGEPIMQMLRRASADSVVPAICTSCDYVAEMEPDQDRGYCEACGKNTVQSCLILAGLI